VIYAGGWADAEWLAADRNQVEAEYVELDTSEKVGQLLDRIVALVSGAGYEGAGVCHLPPVR
jgi:hypothetical protein